MRADILPNLHHAMTVRAFRPSAHYQLFQGTNINNGAGHEKETPIYVGHGHAWVVSIMGLWPQGKQDSGRATIETLEHYRLPRHNVSFRGWKRESQEPPITSHFLPLDGSSGLSHPTPPPDDDRGEGGSWQHVSCSWLIYSLITQVYFKR